MTEPYTAPCPTCGRDVEWQATPVEHTYGQATVDYRIVCPDCDRERRAAA